MIFVRLAHENQNLTYLSDQAQPVHETLAGGQFNQYSGQEADHSQTAIPQFSGGVRTEFKLGAELAVLALELVLVTGGGILRSGSHGFISLMLVLRLAAHVVAAPVFVPYMNKCNECPLDLWSINSSGLEIFLTLLLKGIEMLVENTFKAKILMVAIAI